MGEETLSVEENDETDCVSALVTEAVRAFDEPGFVKLIAPANSIEAPVPSIVNAVACIVLDVEPKVSASTLSVSPDPRVSSKPEPAVGVTVKLKIEPPMPSKCSLFPTWDSSRFRGVDVGRA